MPLDRQRRRRRRGRETGPSVWLILLASVSFVLLLGAMGALAWQRFSIPPRDKLTGCPIAGPSAVHAILVDRSDPLTGVQAERLNQTIDSIARDAPVDARIDLYVLDASKGAVAEPVVSLCRPRSDGNALTENPERIHRAFTQRFLAPLDAMAQQLEAPNETPDSPIMESIKAVCIRAFGELPPGTPTYMTIASDMIENSSILDQYRPYDIESFLHSTRMELVAADCHGAKVDVLYFTRPRDARFQTRMHELFWEKFFDHMDASLMSMGRV